MFTEWCYHEGFAPVAADEWDVALMEFKVSTEPRKAFLENLVAAVELFFPTFKVRMPFIWMALDGLRRMHDTRHHTPCGRAQTCLLPLHLSVMGHLRLAGRIVLAQRKGFRPGELLKIIPSDISLPEDKNVSLSGVCTIGLGMASGTKVKRPQYCILQLP